MAARRNKKLMYFIVIVVVFCIWAFVLFYPWPKVPYDYGDTGHSTGGPVEVVSPDALKMTLVLHPSGLATLTITNNGPRRILLADNIGKSAFTAVITDVKGFRHRSSLGLKEPGTAGIARIELLPGTAYHRELSLLGLLQPYRDKIDVSVCFQPGYVHERYAIETELESNTVSWTPFFMRENPHERENTE
ncbi:MAG: hypothetical protein JW909_11480 [Planctomycetes bacterium]|nr:hypothetical protein [Planctomycetota bacterium]